MKAVVVYSIYYFGCCLQELGKTAEGNRLSGVTASYVANICLDCYRHTSALSTFQLILFIYFFSLLHRACCRVTQLLYQPLHIYKIYKIYTLKRSDMFRS